MIKLESCHSNVANFPQVLPKWVIGRKETVTKRGQIWFSHPLSADLESKLYNDTDWFGQIGNTGFLWKVAVKFS